MSSARHGPLRRMMAAALLVAAALSMALPARAQAPEVDRGSIDESTPRGSVRPLPAPEAPLPAAKDPDKPEKRVALVIGNTAYRHVARLPNATADSSAVATALTRLGFTVIEGRDLGINDFTAKLRDFARAAAGADLALVFYAGHAVQVDGENWIIPVDARLRARTDLLREAVSFGGMIQPMLIAPSRVVILDACRDNPFREGFLAAGRTGRTGLAMPMETESGTHIAYATGPDMAAFDGAAGPNQNSPFTAALVQELETPGIELRIMFQNVRNRVIEVTRNQQRPTDFSSLTAEIFLAGRPTTTAASDRDIELAFWRSIENSALASDFTAYLARYPDGMFASVASSRRLDLLRRTPFTQRIIKDCPTCPDMMLLPAGTFIMGAPASDRERGPEEGPAHRVDVRPFAIGRYPVTQEQWLACVAERACRPLPAGEVHPRRPVTDISFEDARGYAQWLARKTGKRYRLPSEAEWEYAARANVETPRFWGADSANACRFANVFDQSARRSVRDSRTPHGCSDGFADTAPVGSFQSNAFGLYDMIGNAWQWTADCWVNDYRNASGTSAPHDPQTCSVRTLRGGSFMSEPANARVTSRMQSDPEDRDITFGFRLARDADQ